MGVKKGSRTCETGDTPFLMQKLNMRKGKEEKFENFEGIPTVWPLTQFSSIFGSSSHSMAAYPIFFHFWTSYHLWKSLITI
jgi:hypothetical protein